ncbi:MAG: ABC transporter ATP-binding protein [Clostridiales bacterium]|nr:ABC transporter ATP-binding protein [Clostridiales bacterium]
MRKLICLKNVTKDFDGQIVLKGINLDIYENEFVTLLGPSGCGKTTILRILGGFLSQTKGEVYFDEKEISSLPPYKREINTVFQKYALFPHMNVYDNVAFGLKIKKEPKDIIEKNVMRMLKLVGLEDYAKRSINEMSGGQQQRVAIARALVNEPKVLLLDEPLGALDFKLRKEMQKELKKIQQEVGITFIFVTHDQEEALTMSDKIVVMNEGEVQQIGTPEEVYNEPKNRFVAGFIGESNIIEGTMPEDRRVSFGDRIFDCVDSGFAPDEKIDVVIRPEDIDITDSGEGCFAGVVKSAVFKGIFYETIVEIRKGTEIRVKMNVADEKPVFNAKANEKMSANDFYLDIEDVPELTKADIIARAGAQAWNPDTDEWISINKVDYEIKAENGVYPVTFFTQSGTNITVNMVVDEVNKVVSEKYGEEIYAVNFYKTIDEIKESVALETDLKTWANASAWILEGNRTVEITDVIYGFDPENITPGIYDVVFRTRGYDFLVTTTKEFKPGDHVGISFGPDDLHIMHKEG